mgnify:CR=1 FL=1
MQPAVVAKIHEGMQKVKQITEVKAQMARLGAIPFDMSTEQFGSFVQSELNKWTKVIQSGNIQAE